MRALTPQTIFISHATPGDNYFVTWLSSKLKLLGYSVWVELDELKLGDAFWPEIENVVRNQACKFLAVVSKSYLEKITDSVSGVFKELSCADRIKDIKSFKSAIRIDCTAEDDFPVQLMGLHSINFHENWQNGLEKLLDSFQKENIPKDGAIATGALNFWLDALALNGFVSTNPERIYTNWFPFQLPEILYIHKPLIASKPDLMDIDFSFLEYSDRHICFFPPTDYPASIASSSTVALNINSIITEQFVPVDDFLTLTEPRKKVVELINKTVEDFFIKKDMRKHKQAKSNVYYFRSNTINRKRTSLKAIGKHNVAIAGINKDKFWSFGISSYAILYPSPYLKLDSHIVFENDQQVVYGTEEHHALRRKFAFDWYNKDWFHTLLGMSIRLAGGEENNKIKIPVSASAFLEVDAIPEFAETDFGYDEPTTKDKDEE